MNLHFTPYLLALRGVVTSGSEAMFFYFFDLEYEKCCQAFEFVGAVEYPLQSDR